MTEDQLQELRRKRLAGWLKSNGGARHVCEKYDLGRKVESHISQIVNGYSFGARAARNMEAKLRMEDGHLDGQSKQGLSLSADALMLARWFDRLTDGKDRSEAYFTATEAIVRALDKHDLQPTDKPMPLANHKTQPV